MLDALPTRSARWYKHASNICDSAHSLCLGNAVNGQPDIANRFQLREIATFNEWSIGVEEAARSEHAAPQVFP